MRARRPWQLVAALALGFLISGCGKSLPSEAQSDANPKVIAPVNPQGAGGLATKNTTRLGGADPATDAAAVSLAVYPGLTAASRPQAVVLVDEQEWPEALAAAALAGAPLNAPLLYSNKGSLPEVSAQALRAMQPKGAASLDGAQVISVGAEAAKAVPSTYRTRKLTGASSYEVAAQVGKLIETTRGKAPSQGVVAAADGPQALAMPGAGLAAESGVPILLVSSGGVPSVTSAQLKRWHHPAIYVIGSSAAVSSATAGQLGRYGTVKRIVSPVGRISPDDPIGNAIAVALFSDEGFGWGVDEPGHGLVFANATRPLDAPAAAPLSASGQYGPLLLLEGPDSVPVVLSEYLTDIRPGYSEAPAYKPAHGVYNHGWLIGDESAISATTQAELDALLEISPSDTTSSTTSSTTAPSSTASSTATSSTTTPATSLPLPKK